MLCFQEYQYFVVPTIPYLYEYVITVLGLTDAYRMNDTSNVQFDVQERSNFKTQMYEKYGAQNSQLHTLTSATRAEFCIDRIKV